MHGPAAATTMHGPAAATKCKGWTAGSRSHVVHMRAPLASVCTRAAQLNVVGRCAHTRAGQR